MFTKIKKAVLFSAVCSSLSLTAAMADPVLKAHMQSKFPSTPITDVSRVSDFPGVIELVVGGKQIFYTNESGNRLLIGHIFNPATNEDITQGKIEELNKLDWSALPLNKAITITKGKGEREIAVFTDPDCPFCKKLDHELTKIDNVKIHVFPYPLEMHPQAKPIAKSIYCAKDQKQAWLDYMLKETKPVENLTCKAAATVDENIALGNSLGISGTPAIIAKNGRIKPGFLPAAQLEEWIASNSPVAALASKQDSKK